MEFRGKIYKWQRIQLPIGDYLRKTEKKKKKTKKLPTGDSPSLQKYASNLHINEAQACSPLSGRESIAKILWIGVMPGPLPLPLGGKKKGLMRWVTGKGSTSGESGDTGAPQGAGDELVCAQLIGGSLWQVGRRCWTSLGSPQGGGAKRSWPASRFTSPAKASGPKVDVKT